MSKSSRISSATITSNIKLLTPRKQISHKGTYGKVFVLAGSRGMLGAGALTAISALRSGAGLVYWGVPDHLVDTAQGFYPEIVVRGLPTTSSGSLSGKALPLIQNDLKQMQVLAIGPGLGVNSGWKHIITTLLNDKSYDQSLRIVIDADGLNNIDSDIITSRQSLSPLCLTPHLGEYHNLTGINTGLEKPLADKQIIKQARDWRCALVLKNGPSTVYHADGTIYPNPTGNPGMATAGSGDVLTGIIAGLSAQGLTVKQAAMLGTHLHGLAGDLAAKQLGQHGMLASDIVHHLPMAMKTLITK